MTLTKADCEKTKAEIKERISKSKEYCEEVISKKTHNISNKLQLYMEKGLDKLEEKIDKIDDKLDDYSQSKVSNKMFMWVIGILIAIMMGFSGLLLKQTIDISVIKIALGLSEIITTND